MRARRRGSLTWQTFRRREGRFGAESRQLTERHLRRTQRSPLTAKGLPVLRLPVRLLAGALMFSLTSMLGAAHATTEPTDPRAAIELDTDLTLNIARCEGCTVQLFSYDGVNPGYSSQV